MLWFCPILHLSMCTCKIVCMQVFSLVLWSYSWYVGTCCCLSFEHSVRWIFSCIAASDLHHIAICIREKQNMTKFESTCSACALKISQAGAHRDEHAIKIYTGRRSFFFYNSCMLQCGLSKLKSIWCCRAELSLEGWIRILLARLLTRITKVYKMTNFGNLM